MGLTISQSHIFSYTQDPDNERSLFLLTLDAQLSTMMASFPGVALFSFWLLLGEMMKTEEYQINKNNKHSNLRRLKKLVLKLVKTDRWGLRIF